MRRPLAIILVLFFALGPLQGVLEASEDSRLPACCRRHGEHHCAMREHMLAALEHASSATPTISAPATCPEFPGFVMEFSTPSHALVALEASLPILLEQAHSPIAASAFVRIARSRMRAGRAPPSSL